MMQKITAYGCISTPRSKSVVDIKRTKTYKQAVTKLTNLFLSEDIVKIDVINSHNRKRPELEKILNESLVDDVIIITSIYSLGNAKEIALYYKEITDKGILLLIPNYDNEDAIDKFSTCDFGFSAVRSREEIEHLQFELTLLNDNDIKDNKGRIRKEISPEFIASYWEYENFFIQEVIAFQKAGVSKRIFRQLADEYEKTGDYLERLEQEEANHKISAKPKRFGAIPSCFEQLIQMVDCGKSLNEACNILEIPLLNEINFKRFILKLEGKKALVRASKEYFREELNQIEN